MAAHRWYIHGRNLTHRPHSLRRAQKRRQKVQQKGIVACSLIPGFARYKDRLSATEYVARVVTGDIWGDTLSFQLRNGFVVSSVLQNYIEDIASDNWATLIEWLNPGWRLD